MSYVLILYLTIHLFLHAYFQIATLSVEKDIEAVAPLHMEEDENGDDKMAVEEEKASAESKGTRAVSDIEMKETNESEGSNLQLDKESDAEISKWVEKVCLNTFGVCLYSYILLVSNLC